MSPKMNSSAEWPLRSSSESSSSPPPVNGGCHQPGGRSESSSVSASQLFTKWLIKKQANSSENDSSGHHQTQSMMNPVAAAAAAAGRPTRGQLFPARLALGLGMAKTLLGVLLVAFGALALWEQASMSYLGSGEFVQLFNTEEQHFRYNFRRSCHPCIKLYRCSNQ